jgi:hypothetical protein
VKIFSFPWPFKKNHVNWNTRYVRVSREYDWNYFLLFSLLAFYAPEVSRNLTEQRGDRWQYPLTFLHPLEQNLLIAFLSAIILVPLGLGRYILE